MTMEESNMNEDLSLFVPAKQEHISMLQQQIGDKDLSIQADKGAAPVAPSASLGVNVSVTADLAKIIEASNKDPARIMLVNMVKDVLYTVGGDMYNWYKTSFYPWVKRMFTGSDVDTYNAIGYLPMRHGDRLWVLLDDADDQVTVVVNAETVNQLTIDHQGAWVLADAFPVGKQLLMMTIINSEGGEFSGNITLARNSEAKDTSKYFRYVANPERKWSAKGTKHHYWVKIETR
jgi:hypothetical protein